MSSSSNSSTAPTSPSPKSTSSSTSTLTSLLTFLFNPKTATKTTTTYTHTVHPSYLTSRTFALVNPHHYTRHITNDTVSITVPLSSLPASSFSPSSPPPFSPSSAVASDHLVPDPEILLARFLRGFFSGWVFWPESLFINSGGWKLLPKVGYHHYSGFYSPRRHGGDEGEELEQEPALYQPRDLPRDRLIPLGSKIASSFQIVGWHFATARSGPAGLEEDRRNVAESEQRPEQQRQEQRQEQEQKQEENETGYSYVDVAFGNNSASFAGCHRLGVRILPSALSSETSQQEFKTKEGKEREDREETMVQFSVSCFTCNPTRDVSTLASWPGMPWVHGTYARLLCGDGVAEVLRG